MSATEEAWAPAGESTPTLNDELAAEAQHVHNQAVAAHARRGTKHDPEL